MTCHDIFWSREPGAETLHDVDSLGSFGNFCFVMVERSAVVLAH